MFGRCKASPQILQPLHEMLAASRKSQGFLAGIEYAIYSVEYVRKSESAWVLFVRTLSGNDHLVVKILCAYQDARYQLNSIQERQDCQFEALLWNSVFTPSAYYGLACICNFDVDRLTITLGQVLVQPERVQLDPGAEYALVMRQLPEQRNLEVLLDCYKDDEDMLSSLLLPLIRRVAQIHRDQEALVDEEALKWGSAAQIHNKLLHNLSLANPIIMQDNDALQPHLVKAKKRFISLRNAVEERFHWEQYDQVFEHRLALKCIKHCHGDLKSPNIWVEVANENTSEQVVAILDAIDFNPMYSHIDVLSDFATLIIDIQARTAAKFPLLIETLVKLYLSETQQEDTIILRATLDYYLFEKAYIFAAISIIYDNLPDLGLSYLEVAEQRYTQLMQRQLVVR